MNARSINHVELSLDYFDEILDFLNNQNRAPIVELNVKTQYNTNRFFAKLEHLNPTGSIKDVSVASMIYKELLNNSNKNHFVIPSSGNAGISLAYFCKKYSLMCTIYAPSTISKIKLNYLKKLEANVVICDHNIPPLDKGGWIYEAHQFVNFSLNTLLINQFNNPNNINIHQEITGKMIINHFEKLNIKLDKLFVGIGSGGTFMGISKCLKMYSPWTKIIAVEPVGGILFSKFYGNEINYVDHKIESLSADFIPDNINLNYIDEVFQSTDMEYENACHDLFFNHGIFSGQSSGFVYSSVINYTKSKKIKSENIGFLITDNGYRDL